MGGMKRLMEYEEKKLQWAKGILIETGALGECELHGEITDNLDPGGVEEAIELARAEPFDDQMTPVEAENLINEALTNYSDECGYCAKNAVSD